MNAAVPLIIPIPQGMSEENFWFLLRNVWFFDKIQQFQILLDGLDVIHLRLGRRSVLVGNKI